MKSKLIQVYLPRVFTALIFMVFASFLHFSFNQNTHVKWLEHTTSYSKAGELAFNKWIREQAKEIDGLAQKPELSQYMSEPDNPGSINGIKVLLKQFSYITGIKNLYTYSLLSKSQPFIPVDSAMPLPEETQEILKKIAAQEKEHLFLITNIGTSPYFVIGQVVATELGTATGYTFFLTPAGLVLDSLKKDVFNLAHSKDMFFQVHQHHGGQHLATFSFEGDVIHGHSFNSIFNSPLNEDFLENPGTFEIGEHGTVLLKTSQPNEFDHIAYSAFVAEEALAGYSKFAKMLTWSIATLLSLIIILWPGKGPIEVVKEKFLDQGIVKTKKLGAESRGSYTPTASDAQKPQRGPEKAPKDLKDKEHVIAYSIRTAMKEQRFALLYQPIVDVKTGSPIMYEVFSRIIDENGNVITPDIFMPVAHKENIVHLIDQGAIHTVFDKHLKLSAQGLPVPLSVNLSGDTFENIAFLESFMKKITGKNAALSKKIVFELNSREIIEDKNVMKFIRECHSMGVRFAFDYFGGGANTIKAAKALKLDFVKVNAFHFPITDKEKLKELIIIAQTAKEVGIPLIAERVEDQQFIALCKKIGIELVQGFGIAKPSASPTYKPAA